MTTNASDTHKLITIASGKGGVGKTWLSSTIAHTLARKGKHVLLFDGDLGLANIDIQLGLTPDKDLSMVFSGRITLDQAVTSYADPSNSKVTFDVISGQSGSGALASIKQEALQTLGQEILKLKQSYDYTLLDLGAGVETSVTAFSSISGHIVVVVTGDPTSLTDAYAFIKITRMRNPDSRISIVVNMVKDRHAGKRVYEALKKACENFLKFTPDYLGAVRQDDHVVSAIRHQQPLLSRHPECPAGDDVTEIVKKL
ncbi:MinD/ParA family protein [Emcibacter nanhaiensis]|uniref:MinD/ParA family protein n=1 Tax=Emcibacter nanhaiensis TaxID=1505037 RepID=A0A501PPW9_9PROT|nr:MinD/ParA family protein [Emcibacter nanhaiensis]TPD62014.1 MinD/ParA family protein [Emcibacter nanhaiensis]